MRALPVLLLAAGLAAADPPALSRPGGVTPTMWYDLGATAPWMPVLWERLRLALPVGATRIGFTARVELVTPAGATDPTDLLTLAEGCGVSLAGTGFTVSGRSGTWSGAVAGGTLQAAFAGDTEAASLILLLKQLRYANLGGMRTLVQRRLRIIPTAVVGGTPVSGSALDVLISCGLVDQPPLVRWDDLPVPDGGEAALRPRDWWDGRPEAAPPTCTVMALTANLRLTALVDGVRTDVTASQIGAIVPYDWFAANEASLRADGSADPSTCALQSRDSLAYSWTAFDVPMQASSGTLSVVGDLPFRVDGPTTIVLRANRTDAVFAGCRTHPASGGTATVITKPFTDTVHGGGEIRLRLDPAAQGGAAMVEGTAVFQAGSEEYLLPYRIALPLGAGG